MKNSYLFLSSIFFLVFNTTSLKSQTLINKTWLDSTGHPNVTLNLELAVTDPAGNFFVVGNTYNASDSEYVLITKYDTAGSVIWQVQYSGAPTRRFFATDVYLLGNNLYIAASLWDSTNSKSKMVADIFDATTGDGLWEQDYTGAFNGFTVPVAIRADNTGHVYLAGTEQVNDTDYEFTVLKYDTAGGGSQVWVSHYDSVGLNSGAVSMS